MTTLLMHSFSVSVPVLFNSHGGTICCTGISSDIQSALLINAVERAVEQFVVLSDISQCMLTSKCRHLVSYVCKTASFWYRILQEKLCR